MAGDADPKLCWNCGERGVPSVGSRMVCIECEVTWMPWAASPPDAGTLREAS